MFKKMRSEGHIRENSLHCSDNLLTATCRTKKMQLFLQKQVMLSSQMDKVYAIKKKRLSVRSWNYLWVAFPCSNLSVLERQKADIAELKKRHLEAKKAAEKEIDAHRKDIAKKTDEVCTFDPTVAVLLSIVECCFSSTITHEDYTDNVRILQELKELEKKHKEALKALTGEQKWAVEKMSKQHKDALKLKKKDVHNELSDLEKKQKLEYKNFIRTQKLGLKTFKLSQKE